MLASLLAFQTLDDERKEQLKKTMAAYDKQPTHDQIKYLALGFVFLTLVGERQFEDVVNNAVTTKAAGKPRPGDGIPPGGG